MSIKGLTTAAGLWTTGIIGLAVGSGYYELGVLAAALVLLAETVINKMGNQIKHQPEYIVEIHYNEKILWTMCYATARIMPCLLWT